MSTDMTLSQAEAVIAAHRERERAEKAAQIKARFVGKFFKVRNRYSESESWWLYAHALRVDKRGWLHGLEFEERSDGSVEVRADASLNIMTSGGGMDWKEITEQEFREAADALLARVQSVLALYRSIEEAEK